MGAAATGAFTAMAAAGPSPRQRRPAARDRPRPGLVLAGIAPSGLGQSGTVSAPGCAVTGADMSGAWFPWLRRARDLTGGPGIPGAVGMAWCPFSLKVVCDRRAVLLGLAADVDCGV